MFSNPDRSHDGYAVHCTSTDGILVVIDNFSAQDSADEFARDPRKSRYRTKVTDNEAEWLFEYCQREVIRTYRP